ncbi:uncharacterized protein TRIADDRAFT_28801, partial [Trichoplax adhaerens]
IFSHNEGTVYVVSRELNCFLFRAYDICIVLMHQLKSRNILITIGLDQINVYPLIKMWDFDKLDDCGIPACCRSMPMVVDKTPVPVTCLSALDSLSHLAIGFANGSVVLLHGDVMIEKYCKSRVVHSDRYPVTGVVLKKSDKQIVVFIATTDSIISYIISHKDHKTMLSAEGCQLRCSILSSPLQEQQLVVARNEALYFFQTDERGPCLAFTGEKVFLRWFRNSYLIVVSKETKASLPRSAGGTVRSTYMLTIYDIVNKLIAFSAPFVEITDVLIEWGSVYVVLGDNTICSLDEKDLQNKLDILFKKNFYSMAVSLAKSQNYDAEGLADIFTQYGDHLYGKGDYDGAISQYLKTIRYLEPSYVIRKFLDAQRIHNLTLYLEELHEQQSANSDHTTLLLNCYTKLKDVNKLDQFIMTDKELNFDVETAIKVCRQAGYYKHATYLARRCKMHDWYLKIQLEDTKDYDNALGYIKRLPSDEAQSKLKKYGKMLITFKPKEITDFLKTFCTRAKSPDGGKKTSPESFIHIFINHNKQLIEFLEHLMRAQGPLPTSLCNTLLELYLEEMDKENDTAVKSKLEKDAISLLTNHEARYNVDHAMVLAQMHNFRKAVLYLFKKAQLYQPILRYQMEGNCYSDIIALCKEFGNNDPSLWTQALTYFADKENCKDHVAEVLSHILINLLPPLFVIQALARNSTATVSIIKDYMIRRLQKENAQISEDERLAKQYQEETIKMRQEIEELKTRQSAKIFQASKCNGCGKDLDLPAIHFLCEHSFHLMCYESYTDAESECPLCSPDYRKITEAIQAQQQVKGLHEQFHQQLERSTDSFSVVSEYFGRGVFNKVLIICSTIKYSP